MANKLIGRKKEQVILQQAINSEESEMVAIIGRRRVGKTFLIRSVYQDRIDIEFTGVQNATRKEQLASFHFLITRYADDIKLIKLPKNWLEAFHQLITIL